MFFGEQCPSKHLSRSMKTILVYKFVQKVSLQTVQNKSCTKIFSIQKVLMSKRRNLQWSNNFFHDISQCIIMIMSRQKVQQGIYVHTHRACHIMLKGFSTAFFFFSLTPMFPAFHTAIDADGRMWLQKIIVLWCL